MLTANDLNHLNELRQACASPLAYPQEHALRELAGQTLEWILAHHASLPLQPVGESATRTEMESLLRCPPPEFGQPFREVLAEFTCDVAHYAYRLDHPRFFAFIPAAPVFPSILGDMLCAGTNFFSSVWLEAAGPAQVEVVVLDWFREWLGLPKTAAGLLTSGGSEANLTALVVAREQLREEDHDRAVLYVTEQRHWSIDRAAKVMGLRKANIRPLPVDNEFRLDVNALATAVDHDRASGRLPWAVVANAGATNTGTVDPLELLADFCSVEDLWLHVDAAYGWSAVLIEEGRQQLAGIGRADSVTLDPHKWLAQALDAGGLLVSKGHLLEQTFSLRPDYLQDAAPGEGEVNFADRGIALTRRFRALKIWFSLKVLGVAWFRELIAHCCHLADYAQALLEQAGCFEILSPRSLSIVCFRHLPDDASDLDAHNLALVEAVRATGKAFLSSTRLHGAVAIRLCFVNWRTTAADVEEVVTLLRVQGSGARGQK